MIEGM
jgi:hypothetical protein